MTDRAASWENEPLPPVTGTFRTSWRGAYAGRFWPFVIGMGVASAFFALDGGEVGIILGVTAFFGVLGGLFIAVRYRFLGVASVEVDEEAVVVTWRGGAAVRIPWVDVREAWYQQKWHFETAERSVDVREYGFTDDDWAALSFALYAVKDAGPVESLPGVIARSPDAGLPDAGVPDAERVSQAGAPPDPVVFEPQHSSALWWGGSFFGVIAIGTLFASWSSYGDGTWVEEPMLTVFCPVAGFAFVILSLAILPRMVRRAAFLPDTLIFERFVGAPVAMPYDAVLDVHLQNVVTRGGRFSIGDKNSEVFLRLLEPHLGEEQLSGEMTLRSVFDMKYLPHGLGLGIVLGIVASIVLPSALGLPGDWAEIAFIAGFIVGLGVASLIARTALRREMKRGLEL